MKKIIYCLLVICITASFFPIQANAAINERTTSLPATKPPEPVTGMEVNALLKRVDVTNPLDKSTLRSNEKKNAQIEVREGRHRHRDGGGGVVYVSVGAVVLVILLVVILL
jgi:hypothetical protein